MLAACSPALTNGPRPRSKRRWISDLLPLAENLLAPVPERVITARIRTPFARGPPSEHGSSSSASSAASARTSLSLLSLSDGGTTAAPSLVPSLRKENGREKLLKLRPTSARTSAPSSRPSSSRPSSAAATVSRALDRERRAQRHLTRLERHLSAISGDGDERWEVQTAFIDQPTFRHVSADFSARAIYPQNVRLAPALSAVVREQIHRDMAVRHLPPLLPAALAVHNALMPKLEDTRLQDTQQWLEEIPEDFGIREEQEEEEEEEEEEDGDEGEEEEEKTSRVETRVLEKLLEDEEEEHPTAAI